MKRELFKCVKLEATFFWQRLEYADAVGVSINGTLYATIPYRLAPDSWSWAQAVKELHASYYDYIWEHFSA